YNSQNQLLYDLIYCDPVSKVMYLKSNTVAPIATEDPNDPTSDPLVYVGGWQTYLCLNTGSSDLVFDGITFNWGSQLKTFAPRITFHDCTFLASTLYGSSCTGMKIASCYFDYLGGGEWHLDGATYDEGWWEQQLYLYGENMSFHDNFVGRNRSGGDIILWPENSNNVEVYNNVVYQSQIAVQNSGASGNIYNNVLFSVPKMVQDTPISAQHLYPAWYLCKGSAGQQFHNNYVEFANGSAVLSNWSNYIQSNVAVDDNVFVESRGQQPFIDTIVTTSYSSISNNTWIGHGCTGGGRMDGVLNTTNSETFVAYLNANHGTGNVFEQASQFLDVEAADRFLNTDPTLAAVMAYFRNYAARRSVTVSLDSLTPSSNDVLTATAKKLDIGNENNPDVTLTFVWKVNGIVKQTHVVSDPNVTDTFDLSVAGNGDIGDWITVEVTPRVDGVDGQTVTTNSAVVTAATRVWTGGGSDNKWSTAANWAGAVAPAPGDTLVFDNATGVVTQNDLPDSTTFSSLQFTGSGFSVSGNRLLLLRCLSVEGSATLSTDIALGPDSGFLVAGASQLTLSGVLSDSDGNSSILDLEGCGGTVTLTAANTYTGETYIDKCTVKIANDDAIEDSSDVWLACGTLDLNGHSIAIRALDQWGTITSSVAGNVTLAIGSGNQDSQGVIENGNGIVSVTKTGSNVLVLCGINTYTGRTTVQGGTLQLGLAAQSAILNGGGVDIQYGKVVFDYSGGSSPAAAILAALTTSYDANGPARFDTGKFISSVAETDYCGLAWKDNTAASQVTVVYSLYGDANLDGSVDSADQAVVTAHLYQNGNWSEGDFNYDGIVDDLDAAICGSNVGNTVDAALLDLYS
ncbi:MAG: autotransporter-associated beta strand repeat-containing protein, partial [Planctomycetaceae bacterium]|nr:autotransporter-associated beta strand repeat-containing protein [Planctomycetaceae bacterium]